MKKNDYDKGFEAGYTDGLSEGYLDGSDEGYKLACKDIDKWLRVKGYKVAANDLNILEGISTKLKVKK